MDFDEYKKRKEELLEEPATPDDVYIPPKPYRLSKDDKGEEDGTSTV